MWKNIDDFEPDEEIDINQTMSKIFDKKNILSQ